MDRTVGILAEAIDRAGARSILAVTGAGVSVASGIPTFRGSDEGALWKRDPMELATRRFFESNPVEQWEWYVERFSILFDVSPNPAHYAFASLERWQRARGGDWLLVTQNIDTLHERAGASSLVKVHGSADKVRCSRRGCRFAAPSGSLPLGEFDLGPFRRQPSTFHLPRCPSCNAILRPHVLFFDEYYNEHVDYEFDRVASAVSQADCVLFAGTSFSVGVTDLVTRAAAERGATILSIDPNGESDRIESGVRIVRAAAEVILPQVCRQLGARIEHDDAVDQ